MYGRTAHRQWAVLPFLSFTLVGLERGASTQISPADSIAAGMAGRAALLAAQV